MSHLQISVQLPVWLCDIVHLGSKLLIGLSQVCHWRCHLHFFEVIDRFLMFPYDLVCLVYCVQMLLVEFFRFGNSLILLYDSIFRLSNRRVPFICRPFSLCFCLISLLGCLSGLGYGIVTLLREILRCCSGLIKLFQFLVKLRNWIVTTLCDKQFFFLLQAINLAKLLGDFGL